MKEQIYNVPELFFGSNLADTNICFYKTNSSSQKNRVCFSQNLLCFLLKGYKEIYSGTNKISLTNDEILLLHTSNSLMTEKTTDDDNYQSILLFFSDRFLMDFAAKNDIKPSLGKLTTNLTRLAKDKYILNFEKSLILIESIITKNKNLVQSKIEEILLYLLEKNEEMVTSFIQSALNKNKDISFLKIINSQSDDNLTTEELSFLCNMSVSTFKRRFSEVFQTTPKQYFIEKKMKKAMSLLQQNRRPSEIYHELGYENLSGFSNEFKKHYGVSPKTFKPQV